MQTKVPNSVRITANEPNFDTTYELQLKQSKHNRETESLVSHNHAPVHPYYPFIIFLFDFFCHFILQSLIEARLYHAEPYR